ncbi:MAG TPA: hypothetical protein VFC56_11245 [Stellaceae bacterium]|nr:hypothetical protein [Stellaceae bacterium]
MGKLAALLALMFALAGCGGPQTPCDDSDPVGICANAHSHVGDT